MVDTDSAELCGGEPLRAATAGQAGLYRLQNQKINMRDM